MNYWEKEIERGFASDEGQEWIGDLYNRPNSWESNSSKLARIFGRICIFKIGLNAVWQEDLQLLDSLTLSPNDESYYAYKRLLIGSLLLYGWRSLQTSWS